MASWFIHFSEWNLFVSKRKRNSREWILLYTIHPMNNGSKGKQIRINLLFLKIHRNSTESNFSFIRLDKQLLLLNEVCRQNSELPEQHPSCIEIHD